MRVVGRLRVSLPGSDVIGACFRKIMLVDLQRVDGDGYSGDRWQEREQASGRESWHQSRGGGCPRQFCCCHSTYTGGMEALFQASSDKCSNPDHDPIPSDLPPARAPPPGAITLGRRLNCRNLGAQTSIHNRGQVTVKGRRRG